MVSSVAFALSPAYWLAWAILPRQQESMVSSTLQGKSSYSGQKIWTATIAPAPFT